MNLTDDEMWEITVACDETYDGEFFYGVVTVGCYCLPSCRSRRPLRKNVRFFASANEAKELGFHPCKKCRPELLEEAFAKEIAGQIKDLYDAYYFDTITLAEKIKNFGIPTTRLGLIFRQYYDMLPEEYLLKVRLSHAMELLLQNDLSLQVIGRKVGIHSVSAFSKFFRQQTGKSPRDYQLESMR